MPSSAMSTAVLPTFGGDLYTDDVLRDPHHTYRAVRALGPVVRLAAHDVVALPRYAEVREALGTPEIFGSGQGVALNDLVNEMGSGASILMSDGDLHTRLRTSLMKGLKPRALCAVRAKVLTTAERLVDELVERETFDAVTDLAVALTMAVVPDMIGWPVGRRDALLDWASATFDIMGPPNQRHLAAGPRFLEMGEFAHQTVQDATVLPGSIVADMLAAVDRGEMLAADCPVAMVDFLAPSLDTTISGIARAIALFAAHPDQWDLIRADPALVPGAFNEVLRLHSPVTGFTRMMMSDNEIAGRLLPAGTRVLLMFASANRDELKYEDPDRFDVRRNPVDMLGFGYGTHACAGQGLARLEAHTILEVLARRVQRIHVIGDAVPMLNNSIDGLRHLHVSIVPSRPAS